MVTPATQKHPGSSNLLPLTCRRTWHTLYEQALVSGSVAWWLKVDTGSVLSSPSTGQDLEEGFAELNVEGGIDHRVEGAVHVAQPRCGSVKHWRHVACWAVGIENVGQKEGQPADNEGP